MNCSCNSTYLQTEYMNACIIEFCNSVMDSNNRRTGITDTDNNIIVMVGMVSLTKSSIVRSLGHLNFSKSHLSISKLTSADMLVIIGELILIVTNNTTLLYD